MDNIAVDGCELSLSIGKGNIFIISQPSSKVKADGKGVYRGPLAFSVSGYTGGEITVPESGTGGGSISPGASKVKVESQAVCLEGDSVNITITGKKPAGTSTAPATNDVTVKIKSAGQTKVKAE